MSIYKFKKKKRKGIKTTIYIHCYVQDSITSHKSRNTCNTERGKSWSMKVPRAPIRPALQGHKPSTHSLRTLERKHGYGRKSTGSVMQVTSLDAFWSPGAHCALAVPWALFSSQYSSTTSISSETLGNGPCFGAQQPSNFDIKKSDFYESRKSQLSWPKVPNDTKGTVTSTLQMVQNLCGWSCQKGSMSRPEIFIVDQNNQFFTKLKL